MILFKWLFYVNLKAVLVIEVEINLKSLNRSRNEKVKWHDYVTREGEKELLF